MGIDYDGGMIVGSDLDQGIIDKLKEKYGYDYGLDLCDSKLSEMGIINMSPYSEADDEFCVWGFKVDNIAIEHIDQDWIKELQEKAKRFEEITGVKASLIGCQDINLTKRET